jgi:hypothetical protein
LLAISSDLLLCFRSDLPIFQALLGRRQAVFDDLLNAYTTSQQNVTILKKTFEAQASKLQELTGNFVPPNSLISLFVADLDLLCSLFSCCC